MDRQGCRIIPASGRFGFIWSRGKIPPQASLARFVIRAIEGNARYEGPKFVNRAASEEHL